jgi:sigma-B regulation protein RsbU (phosphoserine phosphatase)
VTLEPGDGLILYTDGVPDQVNAANVAFGMKGLHAAALAAGGRSARHAGERIHKAVKQHGQGRTTQFDDITLVCFGRVE